VGGTFMDEWFSEPEPNVIQGSAGFSINVLGRTGLRYTEGGRSVWIDSEVLAEPRAMALFKDSIRLWEGEGAGPVSAADRDRIASNVKRVFEFCGYELQIQEAF